ncbi:hypothetical protein C1S81_15525 [Mycolicibacterium neoaurum]|nr:hypothetical protein C1S81_15525 [Mycolicibacterium neoaurum]
MFEMATRHAEMRVDDPWVAQLVATSLVSEDLDHGVSGLRVNGLSGTYLLDAGAATAGPR